MATFYPQFTSNETISQQWQRYVHTKPLINNIRDIHQANTKEINNVIQNSTKEQIRAINESTDVVCNTLESGFNIIENNLYNLSFDIENLRSEVSEMSSMLDWRMSLLIEQQRISNLLQGNIALLLRIPDIQKEVLSELDQLAKSISEEISTIENDLKKIGNKDSEKQLKSIKKDCLSLIYEIDERKKEIMML